MQYTIKKYLPASNSKLYFSSRTLSSYNLHALPVLHFQRNFLTFFNTCLSSLPHNVYKALQLPFPEFPLSYPCMRILISATTSLFPRDFVHRPYLASVRPNNRFEHFSCASVHPTFAAWIFKKDPGKVA